MAKRAIITGITGQDGSYLAELLLDKGYEVTGVVRRLSASNSWRIDHLLDRITLRPADLLDQLSLVRVIQDVRPHEFYNLAAMSFVPASWDQPMLTGEFNAQGVTRVLEAVRQVDTGIRIYQASSSEMYGRVREVP
ncbi:MAG: NAD-dependent epimerase/dehydratase family protein, partial [Acidobacteria bacterium]|nr:NAD-dependent epimerase/dehydratase family protein [Acidobacteriota bacterium]